MSTYEDNRDNRNPGKGGSDQGDDSRMAEPSGNNETTAGEANSDVAIPAEASANEASTEEISPDLEEAYRLFGPPCDNGEGNPEKTGAEKDSAEETSPDMGGSDQDSPDEANTGGGAASPPLEQPSNKPEQGTTPDKILDPETVEPARPLLSRADENHPRIISPALEPLSDQPKFGTKEFPFPAKNKNALKHASEALGITFRFNKRVKRIEWGSKHVTGPWRPLNDREAAAIRDQIADNFYVKISQRPSYSRLNFGREKWQDSLNALVYEYEVDPFLEWLRTLPKWDSVPRIDDILPRLFGADHNDLSKWASRYVFLGAVQRTLHPGCKLDEIPVLIGEQGIGKSPYLREALPPELPELFSDALRFDGFAEAQVQAVLGRLIVEIPEMAGRRRAEIERIKAFITRQDDGSTRLPYARNTEPLPRRFIIVGTTDKPNDLPNDPSGNRRFVPIELKHGANVEAFFADGTREMIWAEAFQLASGKGGEPPERANLPRELMAMQRKQAELHRDRDDMLEDAVANLAKVPMTMGEIREKLGEGFNNYSEQRIGAALRNCDWKRRQRRDAGERRVLWEPPAT